MAASFRRQRAVMSSGQEMGMAHFHWGLHTPDHDFNGNRVLKADALVAHMMTLPPRQAVLRPVCRRADTRPTGARRFPFKFLGRGPGLWKIAHGRSLFRMVATTGPSAAGRQVGIIWLRRATTGFIGPSASRKSRRLQPAELFFHLSMP